MWGTYLDRCRVQSQPSSTSSSANKSMIGIQQQVDIVQGIARLVQFTTFGRRAQVGLWRMNILSRLMVRYFLAELEVQRWGRYPAVSKEFYCLPMGIAGGKWGSCGCWNSWLLERASWKDSMEGDVKDQFDCSLSEKLAILPWNIFTAVSRCEHTFIILEDNSFTANVCLLSWKHVCINAWGVLIFTFPVCCRKRRDEVWSIVHRWDNVPCSRPP